MPKSQAYTVLGVALFMAIFANAVHGQSLNAADPLTDSSFIKWATTQGALTTLLILVGWSYRKDLKAQADRKDDKVDVLVNLVSETIEVNTSLKAAVETLVAEVRRLEEVRKG